MRAGPRRPAAPDRPDPGLAWYGAGLAEWGGPAYIASNDLSDAGAGEVLLRTGVGGVLFAGFLWLCWKTFGRRLWDRGYDVPAASPPPVPHR